MWGDEMGVKEERGQAVFLQVDTSQRVVSRCVLEFVYFHGTSAITLLHRGSRAEENCSG